MPHKPLVKTINLTEEQGEDEEGGGITIEEAQLRVARLEKELEEQNKFDCLCDGVNSALALVDAAFNGLLEVKDELVMHALPPSLLASLVLVTGKMYRSITDLHTPVRELTRLVSAYSIPWEQKSEQLKKLHSDYESKQRQLNIAVRKLQLIDTAARRMEKEKIVNNWEKVFAKVSAANTHGRRWKFMIEAFKRKVKEGIVPGDFEVDDDDDDDDNYDDGGDSEKSENDGKEDQEKAAADKQSFMMSVITASPPQEEDTGSQHAGSELGSDADGIPSEVTDSSEHAEEMLPDLHHKPKRLGVSFGVPEVVEEVMRPELKDAAVWTDEPEYETRLVIRVHRPVEMNGDGNQNVSCSLTLRNKTEKTGVLPNCVSTLEVLPAAEEQSESAEGTGKVPKSRASRRKSIGFASKPRSPSSPQSLAKSKSTTQQPSSILKKTLPFDGEYDQCADGNPVVNRSAFEEVAFPLDGFQDTLKIGVFGENCTLISMAIVTLGNIDIKNLPVKFVRDSFKNETFANTMEETQGEVKEESESTLSTEQAEEDLVVESVIAATEPTFLDLHGINEAEGNSVLGRLPLVFYVIKKEIKKYIDKEASTESMKELVKKTVGIDMDEISKDDLLQMIGREFHDVCTSAMSFVSSSSHRSGYIAQEELEVIQEQHDKELRGIQAEYEVKLQRLLLELEELQQARRRSPAQAAVEKSQLLENSTMLLEQQISWSKREDVRFATGGFQPEVTSVRRLRQRDSALPDWGAHLPKNVWIRMKVLTEEMIDKRQQLEARIRRQIASNIEKKLASQYKLQRASNTLQGPLQDVSLPAVFMPSRSGNVYNPRAHMYFHPTGTSGDLRLCQPPSIFQLPPLPEKDHVSVVNLFDLSKNFQQNLATDWLAKIAKLPPPGKGSRATTAATRVSRLATPNTPAPTANIPAFDA